MQESLYSNNIQGFHRDIRCFVVQWLHVTYAVVVVVVYSQFLYRYKQTQSAKTRFRQAGARQRVVNVSQQVNKCSEVKYGVFKVEVKVRKEQTAECTGVRRGPTELEVQDLNPRPRQQGKGDV